MAVMYCILHLHPTVSMSIPVIQATTLTRDLDANAAGIYGGSHQWRHYFCRGAAVASAHWHQDQSLGLPSDCIVSSIQGINFSLLNDRRLNID
eukprot:3221661-Pleurochrysis_carterae.AAC.1